MLRTKRAAAAEAENKIKDVLLKFEEYDESIARYGNNKAASTVCHLNDFDDLDQDNKNKKRNDTQSKTAKASFKTSTQPAADGNLRYQATAKLPYEQKKQKLTDGSNIFDYDSSDEESIGVDVNDDVSLESGYTVSSILTLSSGSNGSPASYDWNQEQSHSVELARRHRRRMAAMARQQHSDRNKPMYLSRRLSNKVFGSGHSPKYSPIAAIKLFPTPKKLKFKKKKSKPSKHATKQYR